MLETFTSLDSSPEYVGLITTPFFFSEILPHIPSVPDNRMANENSFDWYISFQANFGCTPVAMVNEKIFSYTLFAYRLHQWRKFIQEKCVVQTFCSKPIWVNSDSSPEAEESVVLNELRDWVYMGKPFA